MGRSRRRAAAAALLGMLIGVGAAAIPVSAASAAQGSVPPAVGEFVQGELLDSLDDMYGARPSRPGTDFEGAVSGPVVQVHFLTEDSRAGRDVADPTVPRDEWAVPVSTAGRPLGTAIVASDPDAPRVHLDAFVADPDLASRIADLGPTAALVRDPQTSSWFALDEQTVFPLKSGTSGVVSARPLDRMDLDRTAPRIDPINPGTVGALVALSALVAVGLLSLAIPRLLRRRLDPGASDPRLARGRDVG